MFSEKASPSNAMHLLHVPSNEEIEDNLSHCHVCLQPGKLTREHIPPKSAFNNCDRLWDRLVLSANTQLTRKTHILVRGGLWVKTLCQNCNINVCSPYAEEYVKFVHQLVESPKLFDQSGQARLVSMNMNTLFIAKEIATMILAIEEIGFCRHRSDIRQFVLDKNARIDFPFSIYGFLVPETHDAGTVSRYHARVDTYAPGYALTGGEISWFPFGFVYASTIGTAYQPEKLTNISSWFKEVPASRDSSIMVKLYCCITGVDSMQSMWGNRRVRPQIDSISDRYV